MKNKNYTKILFTLTAICVLLGMVLMYYGFKRVNVSEEPDFSLVSLFRQVDEGLRLQQEAKEIVYFNDDIYHNPSYRFSLRPPKGWQIKEYETQMYGMAVRFEDSNNADIFVYVEDPKGQDLQQVIDQYKRVLGDKVISEEALDSIIGTKGYILEILQPQPKYMTHQKKLVVVEGDKTYIVSVSALQDEWENYENLFDSVLSSFKLEILLY